MLNFEWVALCGSGSLIAALVDATTTCANRGEREEQDPVHSDLFDCGEFLLVR